MSLVRRSIVSTAYNVTSNGLRIVILFFRSVMLARILPPEVFGIYAFAQAIIATTSVLPTFGLGSAFIHRSPESDNDRSPGVYLTLISAFTLVWAVILVGWAAFFVEPERRLVLWVLVVVTFLSQLVSPAQAILAKRVLFHRLALLALVSAILSTPIALFLAWQGKGIWSLLIVDIINVFVLIVGLYIIYPVWRPQFVWSSTIARYFLKFGGQTMQAGILVQLIDRIDDLWTGYFLGNTALGYYSRAYTFANYPRRILAGPINAIALSAYAEVKHDRKRLSQAFFYTNALMIRTGFLFAGVLFLVSGELVPLLLGEKWLPMVDAFRLMIAYTMLDPIKFTVGHLYIAVGQPHKLAQVRLYQLFVLVIGLFTFGFRYGITGVALAATIMVVFGMIALLWEAHRYVTVAPFRLFGMPLMALVISGVMGYGSVFFLSANSSYWQTGIVKFLVFSLFYVIILLLVERHYLFELFKLTQRSSLQGKHVKIGWGK